MVPNVSAPPKSFSIHISLNLVLPCKKLITTDGNLIGPKKKKGRFPLLYFNYFTKLIFLLLQNKES